MTTASPESADATGQQTRLAAMDLGQAELLNAVHGAMTERSSLFGQIADLQAQIAVARRHPIRLALHYFQFHLLSALSRLTPPLPIRTTSRFARSARKRDPDRSLAQLPGAILPPETEAAQIPAAPPLLRHATKRIGQEYRGRAVDDPQRPNVLVVSHEAGRTGAPILALNLVQSFAKRYNVTALCLRGGDILDNFRDAAVNVRVPEEFTTQPAGLSDFVAAICAERSYAFAVVNSIESRGVLKCLRDEQVPTVSLLHEFASYTRPRDAFPHAFHWSSATVFSTRLTLENALSDNIIAATPSMHVLPQGKCAVPTVEHLSTLREVERSWLQNTLRPVRPGPRRFVVIGAGFVQIRKGVDLFIETATRVLQSPGGEHAFFAWIGSGFDAEHDMAYSVYLRDQLRRAGIGDRVVMLRETSEIEYAYELADALLLSSRLDPLPNVAIDAMCVGLPVLCFDNTTGIADFLTEAGLREECVATYIDTADLAAKVLALASSPARCASSPNARAPSQPTRSTSTPMPRGSKRSASRPPSRMRSARPTAPISSPPARSGPTSTRAPATRWLRFPTR